MNPSQQKNIQLKILGTHCASCEVLIERKFKKIDGVKKVHVNHATGRADISCTRTPSLQEFDDSIHSDGYSVISWNGQSAAAKHVSAHMNTQADYVHMGQILLIIIASYYLLKQFDFLPNFSISDHMSYGLIFLIGLVAAVSSCIAVVGGLLLALAGKYNELHPEQSGIEKFKPHIYFNLGRIAGYMVFGGIVGALGSVLTLSPQLNGFLMIFVSIVMLLLGFQLLNLFPRLRKLSPTMPKFISHKIHDLSTRDSRGAPAILGALTFFLPCGFTQALQLYVLASGDWRIGALTMMVFALGTMPALLSLSALSSFAKGAFQKKFLRFAGVLIVLLGAYNINNGLALAGYNLNISSVLSFGTNTEQATAPAVQIVDGKQVVNMTVKGYEYFPSTFTIVAGVPVEWRVDGRLAAGCGRVIVMPSLGLSKYLSTDEISVITFTPTETGVIPFNCSMGMMTRGSAFTVVANTEGIIGASIENPETVDAILCNTEISTCITQKLAIEVSAEKGVFPESLVAKKGLPIELTIDNKIPLSGCMSIWVIPQYDITIPMNVGLSKETFTPTKTGTFDITCSMGTKMAEIIITE